MKLTFRSLPPWKARSMRTRPQHGVCPLRLCRRRKSFGYRRRLACREDPADVSRWPRRQSRDPRSLTLDATVNPDFSQVESDEPQVTANQRYEVFFPEKRPFFLENSDYFDTPETLLFTRRIIDPQYGLAAHRQSWEVEGRLPWHRRSRPRTPGTPDEPLARRACRDLCRQAPARLQAAARTWA